MLSLVFQRIQLTSAEDIMCTWELNLVTAPCGPYLCPVSLPKVSDLQVLTDGLTQVGMTIFGSIARDTCVCVVQSVNSYSGL